MANVKVTKENFKNFVAAFIEKEKQAVREVAKAIGCPEASIGRIIVGKTLPSDKMLKEGAVMMEIGFETYAKLSQADKEKISETIAVVGGGVTGVGASVAAVSASGVVAGLGATGITSGLAAVGSMIGGGMAAGVFVVAAVPILAAAAGFGIVVGIKKYFANKTLNLDTFEPTWECPQEEIEE